MKSTLKLAVYTDPHLTTPDDKPFADMLEALGRLDGALRPDAAVMLGDNLNMLGRQRQASNEEITSLLRKIAEKTASAVGCPLFAVNGNHDGIGTDFFKKELWNEAIGDRFECGRGVHCADSPYYYADFAENELRLIFLSIPHGSDVEAEYPTPLWSFGCEQLKWLADSALNVPQSYDVLLFSHVPIYADAYYGDTEMKLKVFDGKKITQSYISALCGWIEDRAEIVDILTAFSNKGCYKNELLGINADYSAAGRLLGTVSGHMHVDTVLAPGQTEDKYINRLPCTQVAIGSALSGFNSRLDSRTAGYSFDILTVEQDRLYFRRMGDGEDRSVSYPA